MKKQLLMIAALLSGLAGFAHEGHGHTHDFTITHYLIEPEHAFPVIAAVAIVILLIKGYRRSLIKKWFKQISSNIIYSFMVKE